MEKKINDEIKNFFGSKLGRPEIFNRFGGNFVVFDFIRPKIAGKIVEKNLFIIKDNLKKMRNISFEYDLDFVKKFLDVCTKDNLEMGGRGIVNRIETFIKNGLTNFMFKTKKLKDCSIKVKMNDNQIEFE